jgi:type I restriction enzyme R subunit
MTLGSSEADARIIIDDLLRQAGWDPADKSQVLTEVTAVAEASGTAVAPAPTKDVKYSRSGKQEGSNIKRADYVLNGRNGRPLAVIEAKRKAIEPYSAKQQVLPYAKALKAPFIFLTNGEAIYFWDYETQDARPVNGFYSQRDLERLLYIREKRKPLAEIPIEEYYLRQGEQRQLRPYQVDSMKAIDHGLELGKRRFLIELPTGCGKTDLTALYLKRLVQAGMAERILFLVDREQLAKQAVEALQDLMGEHHSVYWLKSGTQRQEKQITVALLQTMIGRYQEYSSGYFDVVVADESHRSIYGAWQLALTHYDAIQIGLTATPAAYIERNTFRFYQCKEGQPDYSYSIQNAFKNQYLVPYKFATGITKLISKGVDIGEDEYDPIAFERKWTNEDSNRKMMQEFDRLAHETYQQQASGQQDAPGKSIVFAITKNHAARLAEYLNELHPEAKGQYASVITSDIPDASEAIRKFKDRNEKYPQVAVTVGMLDTGFDCREVLHIVLCRRVRSPILYQQMRGRGTRTAPHIDKKYFVIYDFFGNHEYFNDSESDAFVSGAYGGGGGSGPRHHGSRELQELGLEDEWLEKVSYIEVGTNGERVDKSEYISNWEEAVRTSSADHPAIRKIREGVKLTTEEEEDLASKLNSPRLFFNEDNLRRAYRNPGGSLIDFIKAALGLTRMPSREEQMDQNFHAWLVTRKLTPDQANYLSLIKNRGIVQGKVEVNDLFRPPLSAMDAARRGVELFGEDGLRGIITEINQEIFQTK